MSTPDLETRIRTYYRTCEPEDSARLMLASQALLDELGANSGDVDAVKNLAVNYTTMVTKDPPTAWNMLSAYSQRAYGSESAFEAAMVALGKRTNYALAMGEITNSAAAISQQKVGPGVWGDLNALADMSRAYSVAVTFPGSSEPPETIVIAPLSATGDWRVWTVTTP